MKGEAERQPSGAVPTQEENPGLLTIGARTQKAIYRSIQSIETRFESWTLQIRRALGTVVVYFSIRCFSDVSTSFYAYDNTKLSIIHFY